MARLTKVEELVLVRNGDRPLIVPVGRKSGREDPTLSRDRQVRTADGWHEAHPDVDLAEFVWEGGVSGRKVPWTERGLGLVIQACREGKADGILLENVDRATRENWLATAQLWDALQGDQNDGRPIRLICVNDGIDTALGDQQLNFGLRALMANEVGKSIARRSAEAKDGLLRRGVLLGSAPVGYGKEHDANGRALPLRVDPVTGEIVREVFLMRAKGATLADCCRFLREQIPGGPRGKGWSIGTTKALLRRRTYLGEVSQGEGRITTGAHPALVTPEVFETVQAMFTRRERRTHPATASLLAGIVRCDCCDYAMVRGVVGGKYVFYRCKSRQLGSGCEKPACVPLPTLDAYVDDEVRALLERMDVDVERRRIEDDVEKLRAQIELVENERAPYLDPARVAKLGGWEKVDPILDRLAEKLDRLNARLNLALAQRQDDLGNVRAILDGWDGMPQASKRAAIDRFVSAIIVSKPSARLAPMVERVRIIPKNVPTLPLPAAWDRAVDVARFETA